MVKKFEETKSLHNASKSGRPSLEEDRKPLVMGTLQTLQERNVYGHASSSSIAAATAIPKKSVCRILKSCGMRTYHISLHQTITDADTQHRFQFAQWILANDNLLDDVLWSDEAYFSMDGMVNRHNCIIWANKNPW